VDIGLVLIDLPEPGHLVREALVAEAMADSHFTFSSKASSVPGNRQTGMRAMDAPKCEKTALERGEAKTESFKTEAKHAPNGALRAVSACRSVSPLP
jgi:hypothetical protein